MKLIPNQHRVRIFGFLEEKICYSQEEIGNYHHEMREKYKDIETETVVREVYVE